MRQLTPTSELDSLRVRRNSLRQRFLRRKKRAAREGRILVTQIEAEKALVEITKHIDAVRRLFNRVNKLELIEEKVFAGEDKIAGQNRLSLRYGKE